MKDLLHMKAAHHLAEREIVCLTSDVCSGSNGVNDFKCIAQTLSETT